MLSNTSLQFKFSLVFVATAALVMTALLIGLYQIRTNVLRNEAQAVANQVVAFRAWIAQSGMVWVNELAPGFHDYLAEAPGTEDGQKWYGKNPALATRELSTIANESAQRTFFRVTSDEYRQADNAPDEFETAGIDALKSEHGRTFYEGFEDDKYRYIQPIYVKQTCLKCHGDPKDAPAAVTEKYGSDKAFGYKVGEVRGVISVKLPDITFAEALPALANPFTLGLLAIAFLINFLYVRNGIISPVKDLTKSTEEIAAGNMELQLEHRDPKTTQNEIDHLYNAVNLLRNSLHVAMRRLRR